MSNHNILDQVEECTIINKTLFGTLCNVTLKDSSKIVIRKIPLQNLSLDHLKEAITIYNKIKLFTNKNLFIPSYYSYENNYLIFIYENIQELVNISDKLTELNFEIKFLIVNKLLNLLEDLHYRNFVFKNLLLELCYLDQQNEPYFDCFSVNTKFYQNTLISNFGNLLINDFKDLNPEYIINREKNKKYDLYLVMQFIFKLFFGRYYAQNESNVDTIDNSLETIYEKLVNLITDFQNSNILTLRSIFSSDNTYNQDNTKNYEIKILDDIVYLRTFDNISPDIEEIEKGFLESDIFNYDIDKISYAIKNSKGDFIPIGETFKVAPKNYNELLEINIVNDMLCLARKKKTGYIDKRLIRFILKKRGIVYGYIDENIEKLSTSTDDIPIAVAIGKKPVNGDDATLIYCYKMYNAEEDKYKDLKEIDFITSVKKDQEIIIKKPATEGVCGVNIFGETIPPKPGKDIEIPVGTNTYITEDGLKLCSSIDGHLEISGGKLNVNDLLIVKNIDYSTGNIIYKGSVKILGDILPEFSIEAEKDVEVNGSVLGGNIKAENIFIKNGIFGKNISKIQAKNIIISDFAESAELISSIIEINKYVQNCNIICDKFTCLKGKGIVKNCKIETTISFKANFLGSETHHNTTLKIYKKPKKLIIKDIIKYKSNISEIKNMLQYLNTKIDSIKEKYNNNSTLYLTDTNYICYLKKINDLEKKLNLYEYSLESIYNKIKLYEEPQEVYINNKIFAKTVIEFNDETLAFLEDKKGPISFFEINDKVFSE